MEKANNIKLPICDNCPSQLLRERLEKAASRTNPLDQGLFETAGQLLMARSCQRPTLRDTQFFGRVEDCGNSGVQSALALTEQILEVTDRFHLDDKMSMQAQ